MNGYNAIVHKGTGVIRYITKEEPELRSDEKVVLVADDFSLSDGPWKLDDDLNKLPASQLDIELATIIPYAVIHTATRVIRRLTIENGHQIGTDETIVKLKRENYIGVRLDDGYKKLTTTGSIVPASDEEVNDADVDDKKLAEKKTAHLAAFNLAVADLADKGITDARLRAYFIALKSLQ